VLGDIREVDETSVTFDDGRARRFDAIVVATGFRSRSDGFVEEPGASGLHYCGFVVSPTGMLREIGIEAQRIADHIMRAGS
jgi:hypothetical protein